jgi:hypothetical protein
MRLKLLLKRLARRPQERLLEELEDYSKYKFIQGSYTM